MTSIPINTYTETYSKCNEKTLKCLVQTTGIVLFNKF